MARVRENSVATCIEFQCGECSGQFGSTGNFKSCQIVKAAVRFRVPTDAIEWLALSAGHSVCHQAQNDPTVAEWQVESP